MKLPPLSYTSPRNVRRRGLTLIELTVVILVLLTLIGVFFSASGSIGDWMKAKDASSILRDAEVAQIEYLADHPQTPPSSLTLALITPYIPGGALATPKDLDGNDLTIDVAVSPPVLMSGTTRYDPSGSFTDSQWDVGK